MAGGPPVMHRTHPDPVDQYPVRFGRCVPGAGYTPAMYYSAYRPRSTPRVSNLVLGLPASDSVRFSHIMV